MQSKTQFLLSRKINLVWGMDKTREENPMGAVNMAQSEEKVG